MKTNICRVVDELNLLAELRQVDVILDDFRITKSLGKPKLLIDPKNANFVSATDNPIN